jgi:hypothetical protein
LSQFALDGTFIGIFAGAGKRGSTASLSLLDETRCLACRRKWQLLIAPTTACRPLTARARKCKRQFGTKGAEADVELYEPTLFTSGAYGNVLVLDHTNRLQVFSPDGKHLCTRTDLGQDGESQKGI